MDVDNDFLFDQIVRHKVDETKQEDKRANVIPLYISKIDLDFFLFLI